MEIFDMIIMSLAVGYIFSDFIPKKGRYDPLTATNTFDWNHILYTAAIVAPAIILHEFGHKFVAMAFGATATFRAAYLFLAFAIVLKLLRTGFIFFVPAYVAWRGATSPLQVALIAAAGPLMNGILWLLAKYMVKQKKYKKYTTELIIFAKINGFLAVFNLIPFPGFDGFHIVQALFAML